MNKQAKALRYVESYIPELRRAAVTKAHLQALAAGNNVLLKAQKLLLMQDLLTGKVPVRVGDLAPELANG